LAAYTDYSIQVTSIDSSADNLGTSSVFIKTLEGVPSSEVRNLTILQVSLNNVDFVWLPPVTSSWNGIVTQYMFTILKVGESSPVIHRTVSNHWQKVETLEA
ncbi:hypothetical protein, partial [Salmonella sp. s54836]|uniref:hypothetical protein n=1 Tax=Salmonella sp. s54836 TaxID=3159673 RepID=UPI00397F73A8